MDSITHIALGAVAGELMLGKKLGRRALLLGAAANSFPDIDIVASLWLSSADNVLAHRGFTHSILCMLILTFIFCSAAIYWDKSKAISRNHWILFFNIQLGLHLFVDAFNAYGVGWFIPFDDVRISFQAIYVVDPFYSSILILSSLLLLIFSMKSKIRISIATIGLFISSLYLGYSLINKNTITKEVSAMLHKKNVAYQRFFTTPTPLNTWLWFAVAEVDSGYHIGYRSVFDETDSMPLTFVPKNNYLLDSLKADHTVKQLTKFSQGYYTVSLQSDTLIFNDLRFGQITGWHRPDAPFAFHYYLNYPEENLLVIQRGRFANWNKETMSSLITRIRGNKNE